MELTTATLLVIGAGFLVANARMLLEYVRYRRRRSGALLTWPSPKPRNYGMMIARFLVTDGRLDKLQRPLACGRSYAVRHVEEKYHIDAVAPVGQRRPQQRYAKYDEQGPAQPERPTIAGVTWRPHATWASAPPVDQRLDRQQKNRQRNE